MHTVAVPELRVMRVKVSAYLPRELCFWGYRRPIDKTENWTVGALFSRFASGVEFVVKQFHGVPPISLRWSLWRVARMAGGSSS